MRNNTNISPLSSRWFLFSCLGYVFLISTLGNVNGTSETENTGMNFQSNLLRPSLAKQSNPALVVAKTEGPTSNEEISEAPEAEASETTTQVGTVNSNKFLRIPIQQSSTTEVEPALGNDDKDNTNGDNKSNGAESERKETEIQEDEEYDYESFHSKFDIPAPALRATLMATVKISPPEREELPIDSKDHDLVDC